MSAEDDFKCTAPVEKSGFLWKRPFTSSSAKWSRRFFVLKDSFMLYYAERDAKGFSEGGFDIHPKGALPLNSVIVDETSIADKDYAFYIRLGESTIFFAADTANERDEWIRLIRDCSRVTFRNAQIGETMIRCLKAKTEVREQQERSTRTALKDEQEQRALLEERLARLMLEKKEAEAMAQQLLIDRTQKEKQLEATAAVIEQIETKKRALEQKAAELEQALSQSTTEITMSAEQRQQLQEEKQALAQATEALTKSLQTMEARAASLESERLEAEQLMERAKAEAALFAEQMTALQQEKEAALKLVQNEAQERGKLERKLQMAEDALQRLDAALRKSGVKIDVAVEADVKQLKSFFEGVLKEAYWDAHRDRVMKEAVTARPQYDKQASAL